MSKNTSMTDQTTRYGIRYERQTCSRCDGSGQYSWNAIHGSKCYGCDGTGETLTKTGAAAREAVRQATSALARDLQVGDRIKLDSVVVKIESLETTDTNKIQMAGTYSDGNSWSYTALAHTEIRRAYTREEAAAWMQIIEFARGLEGTEIVERS